MKWRTLSLLGLYTLMGGSGLLHLLAPGPYRSIIPAPLRGQAAALITVSGVVEIICAMLLVVPRTRRLGAYAIAALLVAVFPANIQMAMDSRHGIAGILTWLRLPLQAPLILWALSFRRASNGGG